jgi:hypothetical protein
LFQVLALRKEHLDFTVQPPVALLNLESVTLLQIFSKTGIFCCSPLCRWAGGAERPILRVFGPEKADARSIAKPTFYFRLIKF